jgi:hypothetical protein
MPDFARKAALPNANAAPAATDGGAAAQRGAHPLLYLQRTIGNQAVQRLLHVAAGGLAPLQQRTGIRPARIASAANRLQREDGKQEEKPAPDLVEEFQQRIQEQLPLLAESAAQAEQEEAARRQTLSPRQQRREKQRPPFPLILKYICSEILFPQIEKPVTTPRRLESKYAVPLGLAADEILFPKLYEEDFVSRLKALPRDKEGRVRDAARLKAAIAGRALDLVADYIDQRMGVTPDAIREEYGRLDSKVKDNIEGGVEGYFACRLGLLNAFGSPSAVAATLDKVNEYYKSLVAPGFLQDTAGKPKGGSTLVHPDLKAALAKAEEMIKARGWLAEILANIREYWSTNIRENRNNPARLSEHSFGFAIDINAYNNPNLAQFGQANWDFVNAIVGEDVFYDAQGQPSAAVQAVRNERDPEKILEAVKKLRAQSDRLVSIFESEENLRARLAEIVRARGVLLPAEGVQTVLDHAKAAVAGPQKGRAKQARELQAIIADELWRQNALAGETPAGHPLAARLVKLLAPRVKTLTQLDAKAALIAAQIQSPEAKASRQATRQGLQALFAPALVKELAAAPEAERGEVARQVLLGLRQPLARQQTELAAKEIAGFVQRGFTILKATRTAKGEKIGSGAGLANVAAQGFANLNEKLVTALVSPQGGNLRWLGVHNQDMHHFELKSPPALPKASAPAAAPKE